MSDWEAALGDMIGRLKSFEREGYELAAQESRPLVEAAAKATAAAGTDPYGQQWKSKRDGTPALTGAESSVTATVLGTVVQIRTRGGYAIQNFIKVHRRQVIPDKALPLPDSIVEALNEGAQRAFKKLMGQ